MEPYQVKWIAEAHLRKVFSQYPGIQKLLLDDWKFKRWSELCSTRIKQIMTFMIHNQMEKKATSDNLGAFIKNAANAYAKVQLERAGHLVKPETTTPPKDSA